MLINRLLLQFFAQQTSHHPAVVQSKRQRTDRKGWTVAEQQKQHSERWGDETQQRPNRIESHLPKPRGGQQHRQWRETNRNPSSQHGEQERLNNQRQPGNLRSCLRETAPVRQRQSLPDDSAGIREQHLQPEASCDPRRNGSRKEETQASLASLGLASLTSPKREQQLESNTEESQHPQPTPELSELKRLQAELQISAQASQTKNAQKRGTAQGTLQAVAAITHQHGAHRGRQCRETGGQGGCTTLQQSLKPGWIERLQLITPHASHQGRIGNRDRCDRHRRMQAKNLQEQQSPDQFVHRSRQCQGATQNQGWPGWPIPSLQQPF